jgi:hypothetical protein
VAASAGISIRNEWALILLECYQDQPSTNAICLTPCLTPMPKRTSIVWEARSVYICPADFWCGANPSRRPDISESALSLGMKWYEHSQRRPTLKRMTPAQKRPDLAWMYPKEYQHGTKHEQSIEDIQRPLVFSDVSTAAALEVLDQAIERANQNQSTSSIQRKEMLLPRQRHTHNLGRRICRHTAMEHHSRNHKEAKEEQLEHQPSDNDLVSRFVALSNETTASTLCEEGKNITEDENLGETLSLDQRAGFSFCEIEDSAKFHIYAGCEEDGCKKQEERLNDIRHQGVVGVLTCGLPSGGVSDNFDCRTVLVCTHRGGYSVAEHIQRPPMTKEMKNQVRVRNICQQWKMVMTTNRRQAMIATALDGMYL